MLPARTVRRPRKPYSERSIPDKTRANWAITLRLYSRGEYGSAVLRAAATLELAIEHLLHCTLGNSGMAPTEVKGLLQSVRGIGRRIDQLCVPVTRGSHRDVVRQHRSAMKSVAEHRNSIIHQGRLENRANAINDLRAVHAAATALVRLHEEAFTLEEFAG